MLAKYMNEMKRDTGSRRLVLPFGISGAALRITLVFAVLAGLWIVISDRILEALVKDTETMTLFSIYKGSGFVVIVALIIYVERAAAERARARAGELDRERSLLFDQAPYPMCVYDSQSLAILAVNEAAVQRYGYTQGDFERMTMRDLYPPGAASGLDSAAFPADAHLEHRHRTGSGALMDVEIETRETQFAGRPARLAVINDVTARRQADQSLRRTQYIVDHAPEPMARISHNGNILYVNDATCRSIDMPCESILNRKFWELFPMYTAADWPAYWESLRVQGNNEEQLPIQLADGQTRYLLLSTSFVRYEDEEYVVVYGRDMTARLQTELALQQSEERYRAISELSSDYSYSYRIGADGGLEFEWVTEAYTRITGYKPEDWSGNDDDIWSSIIHPDDRAMYEARLRQLLAGEAAVSEFRILTKDGPVRWLRVYATPVRDESSGKVARIVGAAQDISTNKQAEERIKQQLAELRALYAAAQELTGNLDSMQLARSVTRNCVDVFGVKKAWVGQASSNGQIVVLDQYPPDAGYPGHMPIRWDNTPAGQCPAGRAIRQGVPVVSDDLAADSEPGSWRDMARQYGFASTAALPLVSRSQPFGALLLHSGQRGFFTPERQQFFQSYSLMAAAALDNARMFEETRRRLSSLQAQHKIDVAIASDLSLNATLDIILEEVVYQLHVDAADILLFSPETNTLSYAAGTGFNTRTPHQTRLRLGEGFAGHAALEHRIAFGKSSTLRADTATCQRDAALFTAEGFASLVAVPLTAKSQIIGVLEVFQRSPLNPDDEWVTILETLADQATLAIDNAALYESMQRTNKELVLAYEATIEGWSRALDLRDQRTQGHTQRVAEIATDLARAMGLSEAELVHIRRGALLHDMGKIAIPDQILNKPGPLTEEEMTVMRRHPRFAYEMLAPITFLHSAIDIPYCHHEKWDGSGYPRGLKGREIPLAARIFAVVDVWDALRSDRPYRNGWPEEQVIAYILTQSGTHFDPEVVETFMRMQLADAQAGRV